MTFSTYDFVKKCLEFGMSRENILKLVESRKTNHYLKLKARNRKSK